MNRIHDWRLADNDRSKTPDDMLPGDLLDLYRRREAFLRTVYYILFKDAVNDIVDVSDRRLQLIGFTDNDNPPEGIRTSTVMALRKSADETLIAYTASGSMYELLYSERNSFQWNSMLNVVSNLSSCGRPIGYKPIKSVIIRHRNPLDTTGKFTIPAEDSANAE